MKQLGTVFIISITMAIVGCHNSQNNTTPGTPSPVPIVSPESEVQVESADVVSKAVRLKTNGVMMEQSVASYGLPSVNTPPPLEVNTEKYQAYDENRVKLVAEQPISTFSIDVDTAAYSNIRRMLDREGRLPPKDAVRVEELINYFSYDYDKPESLSRPFSVTTELAPSPWNSNRVLMQIGLRGYEPVHETRPDANLVFLIDVSGSMGAPDKLPLLKRSLGLLVRQMTENDRIALVVYAGAAGLVLDSTPASQQHKIIAAMDRLNAGGSTNGGAGLELAYQVAQDHFIEDGINRVIIASDGDMNVGVADHNSLVSMIENKRKTGIALTTLGFGSGNYNYALMEQIADHGNGNAAYIDSIREAQKVLVTEMNSTLLTIAKDVKIQIEFNPDRVAEYRLIGYENRLLNEEDFKNDKVDAGDIGAGHTVTALYELTLSDSEDRWLSESRYSDSETSTSGLDKELGFVRVRFKQPDAEVSEEISRGILMDEIKKEVGMASDDFRFAAAVASFGETLRGGKYTGQWASHDIIRLAQSARGQDTHGYRGDFLGMVQLANTLGMP